MSIADLTARTPGESSGRGFRDGRRCAAPMGPLDGLIVFAVGAGAAVEFQTAGPALPALLFCTEAAGVMMTAELTPCLPIGGQMLYGRRVHKIVVMPLPLDYRSRPETPRLAIAATAIAVMAVLAVTINATLLAAVKWDSPNGQFGGWADVAVVVGLGPLCNGLLLVIAVACAPLIKRASGGRPVLKYVIAVILIPLTAYAADYGLIVGHFMR